jgi:peptide-methionine (S)-S-oxide reductase
MIRLPKLLFLCATFLVPACGCTPGAGEPAAGGATPVAGGATPAAARGPAEPPPNEARPMDQTDAPTPPAAPDPSPAGAGIATLAAGCFWCVEAVLEQVDGILEVQSGYMGGQVENPTYEAVCTGTTGHAEVVQVRFDPAQIGYEQVLAWFWQLHDPTTLNRQGADVGTQYRSAIFFHSDAQRAAAEASKAAAQPKFPDPIVTEISPASTFYPAESYHQDYYRGNRQQGYCRYVIAPKLDKLGLEK